MKQSLSSFLNVSRGLAAGMVLAYHVRHLVLIDLNSVEHKTVAIRALYFFTGFGHEAVMIFFVISGYLVGGITLRRWQSRGPDFASYVAARVGRIYTVLIPILVVGFALDFIGLHYLNSSGLYTTPTQHHVNSLDFAVHSGLDLRTFVGNLLMMQGTLTRNLGTNAPLWSLAYEWWYYCIFALLAFAFTSPGRWRYGCLVVALVIAAVLPGKLVLWGSVWALGIIAFQWIESSAWRPHPAAGLGIFAVVVIGSRLSHNVESITSPEPLHTEFMRDGLVALSYVGALVSVSRLKTQLFCTRLFDLLADFSYSLYLCHVPVLVFLVATGYQLFGIQFQIQPSAAGIEYLIACIVILYGYAFLFYQLTERHTGVVRYWLSALFHSWADDSVASSDRPSLQKAAESTRDARKES